MLFLHRGHDANRSVAHSIVLNNAKWWYECERWWTTARFMQSFCFWHSTMSISQSGQILILTTYLSSSLSFLSETDTSAWEELAQCTIQLHFVRCKISLKNWKPNDRTNIAWNTHVGISTPTICQTKSTREKRLWNISHFLFKTQRWVHSLFAFCGFIWFFCINKWVRLCCLKRLNTVWKCSFDFQVGVTECRFCRRYYMDYGVIINRKQQLQQKILKFEQKLV